MEILTLPLDEGEPDLLALYEGFEPFELAEPEPAQTRQQRDRDAMLMPPPRFVPKKKKRTEFNLSELIKAERKAEQEEAAKRAQERATKEANHERATKVAEQKRVAKEKNQDIIFAKMATGQDLTQQEYNQIID